MKRLISRPITHREIPLQIGLNFKEYEDRINEFGEIQNSKYTTPFIFEEPNDTMEWRLKDQNLAY